MNKKCNQEKINFNHLNRQITPHVLPLLKQILPSGVLVNHEYLALNPTRRDQHLGSFRINIVTGRWADFATGDTGGDFVSLWAYVNGTNQIEAARTLQTLTRGA